MVPKHEAPRNTWVTHGLDDCFTGRNIRCGCVNKSTNVPNQYIGTKFIIMSHIFAFTLSYGQSVIPQKRYLTSKICPLPFTASCRYVKHAFPAFTGIFVQQNIDIYIWLQSHILSLYFNISNVHSVGMCSDYISQQAILHWQSKVRRSRLVLVSSAGL